MNTEMMNDEKQHEYFKIFESEEFGKLEILVINERMYFPATEIAETLGHTNPHKAIRDHCRQDYPHLTNSFSRGCYWKKEGWKRFCSVCK